MTILTRAPENVNFLHSNKFQLQFSRLPNTQFFCQDIKVPGISVGEYARVNPFVELYSPGDKAVYETLEVTFLVDEEMESWLEIHNWIRAMSFPTEFEEYVNLQTISGPRVREGFYQFSDATVTLLDSDNNPKMTFNFIDVFPRSLSPLSLSTKYSPDNVVTATADFRFSYYNIKRIG